ncbi:MAG TPA: hypothetical protein VKY85_17485 [Candidatus Angelobacter sp.]|nr:hypothetical protein [Candidatus Angelobacter sp.]
MIDLDPLIDLVSEMATAWQSGLRQLRQAVIAAIVFVLVAIVLVVLGEFGLLPARVAKPIGGIFGALGALLVLNDRAFRLPSTTTRSISMAFHPAFLTEQYCGSPGGRFHATSGLRSSHQIPC